MDPPCPPHWTFAARAEYFGDRMCLFCDHRNPPGAKFCNDCASPLHLKPCNQCNGVNDKAATHCCKCGAAYPASSSTSEAMQALSPADLAPARAATGDAAITATPMQPLFVPPALRAHWRLLRPGLFLLAALATMLIAGAYTTRYINAVTPDTMEVVPEPVGATAHNAPAAAPTVGLTAETTPVEPEAVAAFQAPIPATTSDAPKRASARQRPVTVSAAKRASANNPPAPERRTPVRTTQKAAHRPLAAPVGVPVAEIGKKPGSDQWEAMHVSLARCSGDLFTRIVCDQRVRLQYCEGHWGSAPACASGVANDHGQ